VNDDAGALRTERLYVLLTAEEAARVASLADARGQTVSDFVRRVLLRGSAARRLTGRRALATDAAGTIRQLSAIAIELRRLLAIADTTGTIPEAELRACLAQVQAAINGVAA
jgi:ABC-type xylose transport system permease subunit